MWRTVYVVVACACVTFTFESAQVLAQYGGANAQLIEGWHGTPSTSKDGSIINDNGAGLDAWHISRPSQASNFPSDRFTTLICVTAIICCWLLKPHRYQFQQFGSTAMRFDTTTGILQSAPSK